MNLIAAELRQCETSSLAEPGKVAAAFDTSWTARCSAIIPPTARADLTVELIDAEAILVDPRNGQTHRLNETASIVWLACRSQCTTVQIAEQFTLHYDVSFDVALDAVEQVLARLSSLGLLESEIDEHDE